MSYKVHGLGEILDQVEDVVHAHDQLVDFVAIERRVERGMQQGDGLVGDLVGRGLDLVDRLHVLRQHFRTLAQVIDQGHQLPPSLDDQIRMHIEQIEELGFFGHQLWKTWDHHRWQKT
jgi:hypothetical protein